MKKTRFISANGFSLVEVTLSVAIASLAIITLLGLLPQGLEMSRKSGIAVSSSNIMEQVTRNLENTQWSLMPAKGKKVRYYYNEEGAQVTEDSKELTYLAELEFMGPAYLPKVNAQQQFLNRVKIRIANTGNTKFEFGTTNQLSYTVSHYLVAKTR